MNTENAIEAAYNSHIGALYKALAKAILAAKNDEAKITAAEERFSHGLAHASETRDRARRLSGLTV